MATAPHRCGLTRLALTHLEPHGAREKQVHEGEAQAVLALLQLEPVLEPLVEGHERDHAARVLRRDVAGRDGVLHLGRGSGRENRNSGG